jgi:hypothetical protein
MNARAVREKAMMDEMLADIRDGNAVWTSIKKIADLDTGSATFNESLLEAVDDALNAFSVHNSALTARLSNQKLEHIIAIKKLDAAHNVQTVKENIIASADFEDHIALLHRRYSAEYKTLEVRHAEEMDALRAQLNALHAQEGQAREHEIDNNDEPGA